MPEDFAPSAAAAQRIAAATTTTAAAAADAYADTTSRAVAVARAASCTADNTFCQCWRWRPTCPAKLGRRRQVAVSFFDGLGAPGRRCSHCLRAMVNSQTGANTRRRTTLQRICSSVDRPLRRARRVPAAAGRGVSRGCSPSSMLGNLTFDFQFASPTGWTTGATDSNGEPVGGPPYGFAHWAGPTPTGSVIPHRTGPPTGQNGSAADSYYYAEASGRAPGDVFKMSFDGAACTRWAASSAASPSGGICMASTRHAAGGDRGRSNPLDAHGRPGHRLGALLQWMEPSERAAL